MATLELSIEGMSCAHCIRQVAETIRSLPGVAHAEVRLGAASVSVRPDVIPQALLSALHEAGYGAVLTDEGESR